MRGRMVKRVRIIAAGLAVAVVVFWVLFERPRIRVARAGSGTRTIDLISRFNPSQSGATTRSLGDASQWGSKLTHGWNEVEEGQGGAVAWTGGGSASVDLVLARVGELALHLSLRAPDLPELPLLKVALRFNGSPIGSFAVAKEETRIDTKVPARLQRLGPNRLTLLPSFWVVPNELVHDGDQRILGVCLCGLSMETDSLDEGGVQRVADGIAQTTGGVLSTHGWVDGYARLIGKAHGLLVPGSEGRPKLTLQVLDGTGAILRTTAPRLEISEAGEIDVELDFPVGPASGPLCVRLLLGPEEKESTCRAQLLWRELLFEVAVGDEPAIRPPASPPNVVLLLFDSLRADSVEPYSESAPRTPVMQRLADRGLIFENAFSACSWTRPSVASLLTSLPPSIHGIQRVEDSLAADVDYLPQVLQSRGYYTVAVVENAQVSRDFGFARGFDSFGQLYQQAIKNEYLKLKRPEQRADFVYERFLKPALDKAGRKPVFLYAHAIDPHAPYEPPPPFDSIAGGTLHNLDSSKEVAHWIHQGVTPVTRAEVSQWKTLYDGEVAFMDAYLGRLLEVLENDLPTDRTLVVVLSDHGEEFLEHGGVRHGRTLYEEVVRVPLIMHLPGVIPAASRRLPPMSLLDVMPAILDLASEEAPEPTRRSVTLPGWAGRPVPAELVAGRKRMRSVRCGSWKLIEIADGEQRHLELYDLGSDAEETIDRSSGEPWIFWTLSAELRAGLPENGEAGDRPAGSLEEVDPETRAQLEELGYLR